MADRLTMFVERRRTMRHRLSFPIEHRALPNVGVEADDFLLEYGRDFSSSGIFLETSSPFEIGTQLELVFRLPPDLAAEQGIHHVTVRGVVKWVLQIGESTDPTQAGMGVHFVDVGSDCLKLLEKIVKKIAVFPEMPSGTEH